MVIVLANGCFDLLHDGHVRHLEEARKLGDTLVVGLTMDSAVNKPGRPIMTYAERETVLKGLRAVSAVFPCSSGEEAIYSIRPHIFAKGADYSDRGLLDEEVTACRLVGAKIAFTQAEKKSTTDIINRIRSK